MVNSMEKIVSVFPASLTPFCKCFPTRYSCERNKKVKTYLVNHLVGHFSDKYSPKRCESKLHM